MRPFDNFVFTAFLALVAGAAITNRVTHATGSEAIGEGCGLIGGAVLFVGFLIWQKTQRRRALAEIKEDMRRNG